MSNYVIRNVGFNPDGSVVIDYLDLSADLKKNHLAVSHAIQIPNMPEYEQGLEELLDKVRETLVDAIEDLSLVENIEINQEEQE